MARAPFSIFRRRSINKCTGKPVVRFCARFFDEDGALLSTKTLKATNATKAAIEAKALFDQGRGSGSANPFVMDFLLEFWSMDSDYARMKALRGRPLSFQYVRIQAAVARHHLSDPLRGVRLHQLTVTRMERIILTLAARGVQPRTLNNIIQAVRVPVTDWARRHRAPDPLQYLQRVADHPRERGTMTVEEIAKIIALEGAEPRAKAGALLAGLCGLRMGEVRGLRWADVDEAAGTLHIVGNFIDPREGLKAPKYGSRRSVPLPDAVLDAIRLCRAVAPPNALFVLWNERTHSLPSSRDLYQRGFRKLLESIGIAEEERQRRNLVFHGLRHTFVSLSRATGIPDWIAMRLAGHKSLAMTERYSHAENVIDFPDMKAKMDTAIAGGASVATR